MKQPAEDEIINGLNVLLIRKTVLHIQRTKSIQVVFVEGLEVKVLQEYCSVCSVFVAGLNITPEATSQNVPRDS